MSKHDQSHHFHRVKVNAATVKAGLTANEPSGIPGDPIGKVKSGAVAVGHAGRAVGKAADRVVSETLPQIGTPIPNPAPEPAKKKPRPKPPQRRSGV